MSALWPLARIQGRALRSDSIETEGAGDDDAILQNAVVLLVLTNRIALEDQRCRHRLDQPSGENIDHD